MIQMTEKILLISENVEDVKFHSALEMPETVNPIMRALQRRFLEFHISALTGKNRSAAVARLRV